MNFMKNKLLLLAPVIALVIIFIFSLAQIPSAKQSPKGLPIAIVNEDGGVDIPGQGNRNFGQQVADMIAKMTAQTAGDKEPAVKWIAVPDAERAKEGMNRQEYYGALVIPEDYSRKQASLHTPAPSPPSIEIYVNQGMNAMASNIVTQLLNGIVDNMNHNVSAGLAEGIIKQGGTLTAEQAAVLASPITKNVHVVNQTGTSANAPVAMFQPLWIASLAGAALIWLSLKRSETSGRKGKTAAVSAQVLAGAIAAVAIGFGLAWFADGMLGFDIPRFIDTALFLSVASFSFLFMILAVLLWLGMAGIPIFILLMFFGAPLLALAPEAMPAFYRDWVFPWLPMRFMTDGLRELLFFGKEFEWSLPVSVLVWIGLGSILAALLSPLKPVARKETKGRAAESAS
ncbi:YhgE/Pip domain-containing protein [Paenibacillus thailandensis]|uniref:YhgE/Pip domain-containing protein n=1 Tax=Paenibacillus thailandensis TaxID=393250 RepID=A0ABW5R095_9BACL